MNVTNRPKDSRSHNRKHVRERGKSAPMPRNAYPEHDTNLMRNTYAHDKQHKMVTFKNAFKPEIIPTSSHESYDELFFNVAGLYHTLSFLHDPEPDEDEEPMERSVQLMIAEFLYRSAIYAGYDAEIKPWIPGFRQDKRFSTNDVKRWRRLAYHDWDREDFDVEHNIRNYSIRATVKRWICGRPSTSSISRAHPPPIPESLNLSRVVQIANSCVFYGPYRFTEKDIRSLCNINIDD